MIARYDSLDISSKDGIFFLQHRFYSNLKDDVMTLEEYENVKKKLKNYQTMKRKDLGGLNKIYYFQDTIILYEILEQRPEKLRR